ncbi:septation protein SepH [Kineococcus gypseus]|uniref:septation protein SepH n=1 Tax=Kineococcus gypseus TaxID=1637102 RepID=UPI003D7D71CF
MQDLRLVGVHDDGEHVVLVGADGARYRLRVDEALRAAVRRDRARLGQLQIQMESQLRPRDIQARIRAGESAEEVAESGGLPLDRVRRYEGPVLAERAHVAGLARRTAYGRAGGTGPLEDLVVARLSARAVDPEGARWDAWRQEDGDWTVQLEFVAGGRGRVARWSFDPASRALTATDDEARWLSEEEPPDPGPLPSRRLVSVAGEVRPGERVYDVEADGGVRSAERGRAARPGPGEVAPGLLDALDAQRGVRGEPAPAPGSGEAAPRVDALLADPPPAHPAASAPHEHEDRTVLPPPRAAAERAGDPADGPGAQAAQGAEASGGPAAEVPDEPTAEADVEPAAEADAEPAAEADVEPAAEGDVEDTDVPGGEAVRAPGPVVAEAPGVPAEDLAGSVEDTAPGTGGAGSTGDAGTADDAADAADAVPVPAPERPAPRRRNRSGRRSGGGGGTGGGGGGGAGGKRASVPSWDEIMFGTKKD